MAQRRHWTCVALVTGLALLGTGCGGGDTGDDTTDEGAEATTAVDDTAGETEDTDDTSDDSGEDTTDDDALAVFDIDGVGSYELALTIPSGVCFISDEALTISGDGPNGEAASIDYTASLDTTSVYLDVPADGVQVGAGDAAISGADPVEVNVSGDRVSGSGVFAALDGSGEYEGTFEFVCD
jgi:hypothetical protein